MSNTSLNGTGASCVAGSGLVIHPVATLKRLNRDHARLRAPGERASTQLKTWRLLRRARCSTRRIGTAVQAVHTLLTCNYSG
ncbi:hypothetical protein GCM10010420_46890 [Streptomyces glaucosporus]|uniref:DDE Tnp4 domain-containing protein n=1 Tax=Streptomyces glaucosporus TaxID=284044 RepID=A0ABN3ITT0_9ACTN